MSVYALAGRRPDPEGAAAARFPLENRQLVATRLRQLFLDHDATALVASAACGSDLIALDIAGQLDMHRHVVLPFPPEQFKRTSVIDRPGNWGPSYDRVIQEVAGNNRLTVLDLEVGSDGAYQQANDGIIDTAAKLASAAQAARICLVWEGAPRGPDDISFQLAENGRAMGWPVDEVLTI